MIYLATPFSDKNKLVMRDRLRQVTKKAAQIQVEGKNVYSPLIHNYPIAMKMRNSVNWDTWKDHDIEMLSHCREMRVLMLNGWQKSVGVQAEVSYAHAAGIPVNYINP